MTDSQWIEVLRRLLPFSKGEVVSCTTGTADTAFLVGHTLKAAPPYYLVLTQDKAGSVYLNPVDVQQPKQLTLRASTATLTVTLLLWEV